MRSIQFHRRWLGVSMIALVLADGHMAATQVAEPSQRLAEAQRLSEDGKWVETAAILTEVIDQLMAMPPQTGARELLVTAYEKRALARQQLGDRANANMDFAALLQLDPNRELIGTTEATKAIFEATRKSTLALFDLTVMPDDAVAVLEETTPPEIGRIGPAPAVFPGTPAVGRRWLRPGTYRLKVNKPGYEPYSEELQLAADTVKPHEVPLRRTSAVLYIRTVQPDVRVSVDGVLRGVTQADTGNPKLSRTLVVEGLTPRTKPYSISLEKDCHVSEPQTVNVVTLDTPIATTGPSASGLDRFYEISLKRALGSVSVTADQPGGVVFIDGQRRGPVGRPIDELCTGEHTFEVRAPTGRVSGRVLVELDKTAGVQAALVPTYALLAPRTPGPGTSDAELMRAAMALRFSALQLLAVDSSAPDMLFTAGGEALRDATDPLMQQYETQGVAGIRRISTGSGEQVLELALLARGSSKPSVLQWSPQRQQSVDDAVRRLNPVVHEVFPSLGVEAVDVMRIEGAVVTAVDVNGPAGRSMAPGDVIVGVGGDAVASATNLRTILRNIKDDRVSVRLRDRPASVPVSVERVPTVVSTTDDLVFNVVVTELRTKLARIQSTGAAAAPNEAVLQGIRLNLGVALMAVSNWQEALDVLGEVKLEKRRGIGKGTVNYLRGICFKQLGQLMEARAEFERASLEPDALLTENGPMVAYLALQELAPSAPQK